MPATLGEHGGLTQAGARAARPVTSAGFARIPRASRLLVPGCDRELATGAVSNDCQKCDHRRGCRRGDDSGHSRRERLGCACCAGDRASRRTAGERGPGCRGSRAWNHRAWNHRARSPRLPDVPGRQRLEHRHLQAPRRPAQRCLAAQHGLVEHLLAPGLRPGPGRLPLRHPVHGRHQRPPDRRGHLPVRQPERPGAPTRSARTPRSRAARTPAATGTRSWSTPTLARCTNCGTPGTPPRLDGRLRRPIWQLRSNALRPAGWTSADAAGLPILPGLAELRQVKAAVNPASRSPTRSGSPRSPPSRASLWPAARHEAGSGGTRRCRRWAPGSG